MEIAELYGEQYIFWYGRYMTLLAMGKSELDAGKVAMDMLAEKLAQISREKINIHESFYDGSLAANQKEYHGDSLESISVKHYPGGQDHDQSKHAGDKAEKVVSDWEMEFKDSLIEVAVAVDADGKIAIKKSGGKNYIDISRFFDIPLMRDTIFTHIHPKESLGEGISDAGLSVNDMQAAIDADVREMRALGYDKQGMRVHSIKRPKDGWPSVHDLFQTFNVYYDIVAEEIWGTGYEPIMDNIMKSHDIEGLNRIQGMTSRIWAMVGEVHGFTSTYTRL